MEDFVYEEVSKDVDDEGRRAIAMSRLNDDISTIWRQVACYRFERALHDEYRRVGYVPSGRIGELFQVHMSAYMGSSVEQSPGSERWWIYWSHIRSYFYNYSYAFGLLISKIMQTRVRQDKAYISQVKKFLSVGTSTSPKEILSSIGIDVTNPSTWKEGIGYVSETLKNLP
jgi:oligoendopeptidase F